MNKDIELPDELVKIVISNCPKCDGGIRFAVEHKMNKKEFYKEVVKYNLSVKTISLTEFRTNNPKWCDCDKNKQDNEETLS